LKTFMQKAKRLPDLALTALLAPLIMHFENQTL
jgi:hypothetical protein